MDHFSNDRHCRCAELMNQYGYYCSEPRNPVEILEWSDKDGPPGYYKMGAVVNEQPAD